jgi:hypothetical protein
MAVFFDARDPDEFGAGTLAGARNLQLTDVETAKDDSRLAMSHHNTRIVVFGADADQARVSADRIACNAFHNLTYSAVSSARAKPPSASHPRSDDQSTITSTADGLPRLLELWRQVP